MLNIDTHIEYVEQYVEESAKLDQRYNVCGAQINFDNYLKHPLLPISKKPFLFLFCFDLFWFETTTNFYRQNLLGDRQDNDIIHW